jgi:hypothetical protein
MRAPYTTVEDLEKYTRETVPSDMLAQVAKWIEGVADMMDAQANRRLVADVIGSGEDYNVRYYDSKGNGKLTIDDCQTIETVETGDPKTDVYAEFTDYYAYPKVTPYRSLIGSFPCGLQVVKVTGRFGFFDTAPEDIKFAATVILAGIYLQNTTGNKEVQSERIGNYSVTYATEEGFNDFERAKATIENYRLMEI